MFHVVLTPQAHKQLLKLPLAIRARAAGVFERLQQWPAVSGAKPLRHELKGSFRIRTGDYRILFSIDDHKKIVNVFRIDDRRDVYKE